MFTTWPPRPSRWRFPPGRSPGSPPDPQPFRKRPTRLIDWAREASRDRRVTLRVSGAVDGTTGDVDPVTGSGAVLAADRARAVATALIVAHAVPADRVTLSAARPGRRAVTVTTGFAALSGGIRQ